MSNTILLVFQLLPIDTGTFTEEEEKEKGRRDKRKGDAVRVRQREIIELML